MPIAIPLIAAAFEVGAGVAAVGTAMTVAETVVAGLEIAGGALTAIGAVTGNKTLMAIGAVAGIAGGLGSLVTGGASAGGVAGAADGIDGAGGAALQEGATPASLTGDAGSAGSASDVAASAGGSADAASPFQTPDSGMGTAPDTSGAPAPTQPQGIVNANAGQAPTSQPQGIAAPKSPINPLVNSSGSPTVDVTQATAQPTIDQSSAVQSQSGGVDGAGGASLQEGSTPSSAIQSPSLWDQTKSVAGNVGGAIKSNPGLANAAGGIISGAMKSMSDQSLMKEKYAQQLAYEQAQRDRYNASLKGLAMPTYVPPKG